MRIERSIRIAAPPEAVFDLLADPLRQQVWQRGLVETLFDEGSDPANPAAGTGFVKRIKEGPRITEYRGEILAHDRPRRYATRLAGESYAYVNDYRVEADGDGARLVYLGESESETARAGIAARVFGWMTRRIVDRQLRRLRELAESER